MYTWGYLKNVILYKLDLEEREANQQKLLDRFPFYANEAMTQICSIKPKYNFTQFEITDDNINVLQTMPDDFVSFGDDVNTITYYDFLNNTVTRECNDDDFSYKGYNKLIFYKKGLYTISYYSRWFNFKSVMDNDDNLDAPHDVLDCIPSYVVSQCYKIDDEVKASIYRNEYEMFLARLDNSNYKQTKSFTIGGDW